MAAQEYGGEPGTAQEIHEEIKVWMSESMLVTTIYLACDIYIFWDP